jgi:magnesium and cobalt exporter, CNNM family
MTAYALFALCVVLVAWLTAGAMAVRSASRIWLRHWAEQRLRGASSVMLYLERPQRLLAAANSAIALMLGAAGLWIGWRSAANEGVAMLSLAGYAAVVMVVGHLVPRAIARRWSSVITPLAMPVLRVADVLTAPLLSLGRALARVDDTADAEPSHEAMQDLLREGELEGVGKRDEIAIISGVMEFGETAVREVMTPRSDIFALLEGPDARAVAAQIAESAFSRVPVYRGSLDQIVGMYHAFDVLKERVDQLPPLRPVAYAPADTRCNDLLFRMLRARLHLAVVHDERGQTLGIATLENLLEELVGDIRDEHDEPAAAVSTAPSSYQPKSAP